MKVFSKIYLFILPTFSTPSSAVSISMVLISLSTVVDIFCGKRPTLMACGQVAITGVS
jgi:hypothetical protein